MPGELLKPRSGTLPLKFIIIGGSIAGLAAGYALRMGGHYVEILEQSDGTERCFGGIRAPPNMTRILNDWGLRPLLDKVGVKCTEYDFFDGETGEPLGLVRMHEQMMADLMADFLFMQHGDLRRILFDAALRAGVEFKYSMKVTKVDPDAVAVHLEDGQVRSADVIVGADGHESIVRKSFMNPDYEEGIQDKHLALIMVIPGEVMEAHDDLKPLLTTQWTLWLGDNFFVHGSSIHSKQGYNINAFVPRKGQLANCQETWRTRCRVDELDIDMDQFEPRLRKMFLLAKEVIPTAHTIRQPFDNYVSDSSGIVLVGEAAHPMMPNSSHNASMAIEDAATLGRLFSRIRHHDQIPRIMAAYEELRQPRCAATIEYEWRKRVFFTLPRGEAQMARNAGLREAMKRESDDWDEIDEDYLQWKYERELELFAHNALEIVDDWWTKWGALVNRSSILNGSTHSGHPPPVEISVLQNGRIH
ncbi:hypothetical protein PC9H_002007 [Pleurotus ostreatus]|uniref:FAD-binding domain-containing protein n=2 Tax=Pleurotus ostreatus TaxID=5322 RepID=A0A067N5K1_PLEO1|nr:uncharacterized protein PC9H_002007 [Pleurotus ostreatus]KAF7419417.1 hypothetical protein PC9H_002007 [Pleurotus ostreatus]KAJ8689789.1 hypothetical protein PTI98_012651 [Pleurotus ostreatus]KDQ23288.1 hypothetical protein PLEOSDRAFT_1059476 [Pleurotus ostreatus PC15]